MDDKREDEADHPLDHAQARLDLVVDLAVHPGPGHLPALESGGGLNDRSLQSLGVEAADLIIERYGKDTV